MSSIKAAMAFFRRPHLAPTDWMLLGISLVAAVPRVYLGATQFIEYDGYWHVFIAAQDDWHQFYQEYQTNFHPPLFYLLLKLALSFGHTPLAYRSIPLLTGVAAVFAVGKIAERFSFSRYTPILAALAYGVALPSIIISCEVRSYMLCVFFMLISFYYLLDVFEAPGHRSLRSRTLFAASAILAGYSHYGAFLYICACAIVTALFDVLFFRREFWKRLGQDAITFGAIAAALAFPYLTHASAHAVAAGHLQAYYFQPDHESLQSFLFRNTHQLLSWFSPVPVPSGTPFRLALPALIFLAGISIYLIRRLSQPENIRAAVTVATGAALLSLIAAGGVLRRYPYGGELRQQFFLFPFAVLCGCILLDRIAAAARPRLASALLLSAIAVTVASWSFAFAQYPKVHAELGTTEMKHFRNDFPSAEAIYVDQFNLINFFTHHHDWHWQYIGHSEALPALTIYRVRRGAQSLLLLRDVSRWNLDFGEQPLYADLAKCMRAQQLPSLTVFYTREQPQAIPIQQEPELGRRILARAAAASLCVGKLEIQGLRVYVDFKPGSCHTEIESLTKCTQCDDTNWSITYSGNWQRGEFEQASNATLTFTDDPAASARFSFEGTGLWYMYTRAFNRGFAAVSIDGVPKGVLDLYRPTIEWQSRSFFGALPPGRHTVEIRATGHRNPASTGSYIDIDALEAR